MSYMNLNPLPDEFSKKLGHYVYVYVDPRNNKPFYIGKGQGNRALGHLYDENDPNREKAEKIKEIRDAGMYPDIYLLRYGMTDAEARMVEAAAIDLISVKRLTNKMRGVNKGFGRIHWRELNEMANAQPAQMTNEYSVILININQNYRSDISDKELYEATRGIWRASIHNAQATRYAMAVYQGIVKEVYEPHEWAEAGTWADEYKTRPREDIDPAYNEDLIGRIEFKGDLAPPKIQKKYVGKSVGKHGQNPIRYLD